MKGSATLPLLALALQAACDCGCGYTVNATGSENFAVFTEVVETDFLHVADIESDWVAQAYNVTPDDARGPYGKAAQAENVESNPVSSRHDWNGPGMRGPNPGLVLWNRANLVDMPGTNKSMIPMAEVVSTRNDMLYGSFRVGMKTTEVNGTCGAFFFYFNDTEEIDFEFLSKQQQQDNNGFVNLVIQSPASAKMGYVDHSSPDFDEHSLAFSPSTGYNEYRFDWLPNRVDFYTNSKLLYSTTSNVPDVAGSIHLIHWSNGNAGWSGGPPKEDAALTISYVKAYFNSSSSETTQKSLRSCVQDSQSCEIPTQEVPPNPLGANGNETGKTFFFTDQSDDQAAGPSASTPSQSQAAEMSAAWCGLVMAVWLVAAFQPEV